MKVLSRTYDVVPLLILLLVPENELAHHHNLANVNENAREQFSDLLTTIAIMNKKRLEALKEYTALDSYKTGYGILRKVKNTKDKKMAALRDGTTKTVIHDILLGIICKDGVSPKLSSFKDEISKSGGSKTKEMLILNGENMKDIVNEVLREMICKTGIERANPKSESLTPALLRKTKDLAAKYYNKYFSYPKQDHVNENRNRNNFEDPNFNRSNAANDEYSNWVTDSFHDGNRYNDQNDDDSKVNKNQNKNVDDVDIRSVVLRSSCKKKNIKRCKKACKEAVTDTCEEYDCSKHIKKSFKKKCKRACKDQFNDHGC